MWALPLLTLLLLGILRCAFVEGEIEAQPVFFFFFFNGTVLSKTALVIPSTVFRKQAAAAHPAYPGHQRDSLGPGCDGMLLTLLFPISTESL